MKSKIVSQCLCIFALCLLGLPAVVRAQFTFETNSGTITITSYTGAGGAVVIPATTNGYTITDIGLYAFAYTGVTRVTIPKTVTNIEDGAFELCSSMTNVIIPDSVTGIGPDAFDECTSLARIVIPGSITSIEVSTFQDCESLTNIVLPNSLTKIGDFAFEDCSSLPVVTIPASVTSLGLGVFQGCQGLTSAYFEGNAPLSAEGVFQGDNAAVAYYLPGTSGWGTNFNSANSIIPTQPWYRPEPLVLNFEPSFGVQNHQFGFTISWATNTSVIVQACTNLTNPVWISLATNALSGGTNYFNDALWLSYPIRFYRVSGLPAVIQAQFTFETNSGTITITGYTGSGGAVVIPGTANGYTITDIGLYAFAYTSVTSVTIPNTVTNIEDGAFELCSSMTNIIIPDSVTGIGPGAFDQCTSLASLTIPGSVTSIEVSTFQDCESLTNITLPNSVTYIGDFAFENCSSLPVVTIPTGVTSIGEYVFLDCTSLTNVIMAGSVTSIGQDAFFNCRSLTNGAIPATVTDIGPGAFQQCFSLTSVTIPASVTGIGVNAFLDCTSVTNFSVNAANAFYSSSNGVLFDKAQQTLIDYPAGSTNRSYTIPGTVTNIAYGAFAYCANLLTVVVPTNVIGVAAVAFEYCSRLRSAYFEGNAPTDSGNAFLDDFNTVYYLPGTTGWGATFGGVPALSMPTVKTLTAAGGQFGFKIIGLPNATIVVKASTNLINPVWLPVSTNTLSAFGVASFSDPQSATYPRRYYRLSASQ